MTEIEWLDKVKKNFEYIPDVGRSINQYFREMYDGIDLSGILTTQNPTFNTVVVDNTGFGTGTLYHQPIQQTIAGRVEMAEEMLNTGIITNADAYYNILNGTTEQNDTLATTIHAGGIEYIMNADGQWVRRT